MKNILVAVPPFLIMLLSCQTPNSTKELKVDSTKPVAVIEKVDSIVKHPVKPDDTITTILLSYTNTHVFSHPGQQDLFKIFLTGRSITKGRVHFQILDKNDSLIHNETFAAQELLGDLGDFITTTKQGEDTIANRMKHFFSEDNFILPAIQPGDKFYYDNSDMITWKDINTDKTAVGFIYSHGYEGTYWIAYSKKNRKTVCYRSSD